MKRRGTPGWRGPGTAGIFLLTLLLVSGPSRAAAEPCQAQAGSHSRIGLQGALKQLDPEARCKVEAVVTNPTTSGEVGPVRIPVSPALYEYLLDHPVLMASLVQRLGLGTYQFSVKGPNRFWGNDGNGTQGLLALVHREPAGRIYYIDGFHEGHVFPMVKVKAVVFLRFMSSVTPEGNPEVETSLTAYTRLNDPVLAAIVSVLRPLIGGAVTQKMARAFDVTNQLGTIMAQDPDRILQEIPSLSLMPGEQRTLTDHLHVLAVKASKRLPGQAVP